MLTVELAAWWYSRGWLTLIQKVKRRLRRVYQLFSVPILLRTLFQPWKRIISYPGESLGDKLRAVLDNLVSRMVGFSVRIIVLFTALVCLLGLLTAGTVMALAWPLLPPLGLVLIVRSLL